MEPITVTWVSLVYLILGILGALAVLVVGGVLLTYYLGCPFMVLEGGQFVCVKRGACPRLRFLRFRDCETFWDRMEEVLRK